MNSHDGYFTPFFIGHIDNNAVVLFCLLICASPALAEVVLRCTDAPDVRMRMKKYAHIATVLALCMLIWLTRLEYIAQLNGHCQGHWGNFSEDLLLWCMRLCIASTMWFVLDVAWDLWEYKRRKSHK